MMLFLLLFMSYCSFLQGFALPLQDDVDLHIPEKYLNMMPHTKEEIMEVQEKLNLTRYVVDPDQYLSVTQLITKYGYPVEEHFVKTKDGYILRVHRIPPTKKGIAPCNRVIFLMHGIIMSSADWILTGPDKAFAYHLANLGYDVWMGNARGNTQSRNHTKWSPRHHRFWKFSWHEIGTIDLPTMIDYVLKETKQKALYYVGHSQGTTSFYVMCSELPKYNKKIIAHYSLAPIAFMRHAKSPVLRLASKFSHIESISTRLMGMNEFMPHNAMMNIMGNTYCRPGTLTEKVCRNSIFIVTGFDPAEFNDTLLPTVMGHTPAGCSARQLIHYAQLICSGGFRKYSYFPFNNIHYGPMYPIHAPSYNLKNVKAPVYLYYSRNDWLSHEKDVKQLCKKLGNCKKMILVAEDRFNHMDYVLGIHAKEMIYTIVTNDIVNHLPKKSQLTEFKEGDLFDENEDDEEAEDEDYSEEADDEDEDEYDDELDTIFSSMAMNELTGFMKHPDFIEEDFEDEELF